VIKLSGLFWHMCMLKKFALNILDEVAESCENSMNSFDHLEYKNAIFDEASRNITEALIELSREDMDEPR